GLDVVNGGGGADTDCDGHGTFVAGIIAAAADSDTSFVGVAPRAVILPVRQANDREDGDSRGMSEAIVYAVDNGASVINVSASATRDDPELAAAVEYAEHNDVLVVAALSNDAENGNPSSYPAAYPTVISVGSVDASGRRSSFSETGEGIDLVAPGEDVVSVAAGTSGHAALSGTSFATPFVSGVAALIRSAHPELDVAEVRHRLLVTADHPGRDRPDDELGWGLVNPFRAVTAVIPTEPTSAPAGDAIDLASPTSDTTGSLPNATSRLLVGLVLFAALFATVLTVAQAARRPRTAAVLPAQTTTRHGGPTP
ncbi:MAG: type VII secretion-associated serine protease mycosin, partial [Actinomycetota bacterium]